MRIFLYATLAIIFFFSIYIFIFGRDKANKLLNHIFIVGIIVATIYFAIFMVSI